MTLNPERRRRVELREAVSLRVQVPNYHILSKIVTDRTTIRNLST